MRKNEKLDIYSGKLYIAFREEEEIIVTNTIMA